MVLLRFYFFMTDILGIFGKTYENMVGTWFLWMSFNGISGSQQHRLQERAMCADGERSDGPRRVSGPCVAATAPAGVIQWPTSRPLAASLCPMFKDADIAIAHKTLNSNFKYCQMVSYFQDLDGF